MGAYGSGRNRINGFSYDARGNVTNALTRAATYDGENRQISVTPSGNAQQTYACDAQGRRVRKTVDGVTTTFVYDAAGQLVAEYGGSVSASGVQYLTVDQLGSTRLVTNGAGQQVSTNDYLPFGAELAATYPQPVGGVSVKFTAKERDAETGLDWFEARYFSGAQGRFTSVDPGNAGASPGDPQSWNAYAYSLNNPLRFTDPTGMAAEDEACKHAVGIPNCGQPTSKLEPIPVRTGDDGPIQRAGNVGIGYAKQTLSDLLELMSVPGGAKTSTVEALQEMLQPSNQRQRAGANANIVAGVLLLPNLLRNLTKDAIGLRKQLASEGQVAELLNGGGTVIAGTGVARPIDDINRLVGQYGGKSGDWAKITSSAYKAADGALLEVHAYKNVRTGQIVEMKTPLKTAGGK